MFPSNMSPSPSLPGLDYSRYSGFSPSVGFNLSVYATAPTSNTFTFFLARGFESQSRFLPPKLALSSRTTSSLPFTLLLSMLSKVVGIRNGWPHAPGC